MNSSLKKLFISMVISFGIGAAMVFPIVTSDNGYVAGFVFLPLLLLLAVICLILFVIGIVFLVRDNVIGLYVLLAMLLVPAGFFSAAFTAKQLELGAYREEPMSPIVAPIANKVLFKKEARHDEIENFKTQVISEFSRGDNGEENGHRVVVFEFWPNTSEEQKNEVRERIKNYSPVHEYLENVDTTSPANEPSAPSSAPTKEPITVTR